MDLHNKKDKKFTTNGGIELKRIYGPEDLQKIDFSFKKDLNDAGEYPFSRGITSNMYRDKLWIMGLYSGFGSAEEANQRYRYLLEQGQTGFSIALDLPTQIGLDSDHELSKGEVGKVGVAIDSLEDINSLFDKIPFEKVQQIRTTANAIGPIMTAWYIAFAEKNGIDPNSINFFIQNDPLKEYIGRGAYIFSPKASVKLTVDVIEYCAKYLPNWNSVAMSGYHIRESGSTAIQELAYTFSNGISYIEETLSRGINIDKFAPKIFTFLGASIEFIEELAKFRSSRKIWAHIMKERFQAKNPESMKLKILAYTCGSTLTAQQPLNNIIRVAIETLAATLGGIQTLATSSYDEAFGIPTKEAVNIALRTQQVVAYESGITKSVDLLGGSYALESITSEIEKKVLELITKIDQLGGAVNCIENGYFQKELANEAYKHQTSIENKEKIIVGVNEFKEEEKNSVSTFKQDGSSEKRQIEKLRKLRANRNNDKVKNSLKQIQEDTTQDKNLIPAMVEAVKNYATLGEIVNVLKKVYGSFQSTKSF